MLPARKQSATQLTSPRLQLMISRQSAAAYPLQHSRPLLSRSQQRQVQPPALLHSCQAASLPGQSMSSKQHSP